MSNEGWDEMNEQALLVHLLGQVTCGLTTHQTGDCRWCGAAL